MMEKITSSEITLDLAYVVHRVTYCRRESRSRKMLCQHFGITFWKSQVRRLPYRNMNSDSGYWCYLSNGSEIKKKIAVFPNKMVNKYHEDDIQTKSQVVNEFLKSLFPQCYIYHSWKQMESSRRVLLQTALRLWVDCLSQKEVSVLFGLPPGNDSPVSYCRVRSDSPQKFWE